MKPYYAIQPAFTGGELSEDVASRVDLDKYQLGLKQAENAIVRPYGSVHKRPGLIYCGQTKYPDKTVRLQEFNFVTDLSYLLEFGDKYVRVWRDGQYLGVEVATPYTESDLPKLRFVQSVDVMYICSSTYPVQKLSRYTETDWELTAVDWDMPPFCDVNKDTDCKITPSGTTGSINLTASKAAFDSDMVGDWIKLEQYVEGREVKLNATNGTSQSSPLSVGKTWKFISHGTWTGTVYVEYSTDGTTWKKLRTYTSSNDYNPQESGDVEEYAKLRITASITDGTCNASLSAYPYTHTGYATITAVSSETAAVATVTKELGDTSATADWYRAVWGKTNGYPCCATFFQDRLVFGGSPGEPQRVWMSKTGDYENFGIEKESGTVTDDSAITTDFLSRRACAIQHLDAGNDLVVFTEGNSWTVSGGETVTPSNITPRNQENYGVSEVAPIRIGNRVVYIQRRGSIVRDIGYDYNTDSYIGIDLTLLSKDLVNGKKITDDAYAQEPDSLLYFVRSDGVLLVLTYVIDQKVYAWSHIVTDGRFESVASVNSGSNDDVYAAVCRTVNGKTVRYIERFDRDHTSVSQQDYTMLDAAIVYNLDTAAGTITGLETLEGKTVRVLADGYLYEPMTVESGKITLPDETTAKRLVIGLPYTMVLEQPNWDVGNMESGTVQGREKTVTKAILRLKNSFGGWIGPDASHLEPILYDPEAMELGEDVLVTGDRTVDLHENGVNTEGRTYIKHETPYPFTISAIIRAVTFLGETE